MTTKTMDFETTPFKVGSVKKMKDKVSDGLLDRVSTKRILWHLTKRHKFGIVVVWASIVTIDSLFPPIWDILRSMVS